jgi:hypothetical protein
VHYQKSPCGDQDVIEALIAQLLPNLSYVTDLGCQQAAHCLRLFIDF